MLGQQQHLARRHPPRAASQTTIPAMRGVRGRTQQPHRADIQGLRAIAVALVLLYHLWPAHVRGGYVGVDVFFVISGFLITTHLLAVAPSRGRDLATFWMRRIRRLMPAALLVLGTVLVAARLIGPDSRWKHTAAESAASALNLENWLLAFRSVNYLAGSAPSSPVQHYWSLSVEEQFYLLWPVLLLAAVLLSRRIGWSLYAAALVVLVPVVVLSFAYAVRASATEPGPAFFVTPGRIWELGAGALLAVLVARSATARGATSKGRARRSACAALGLLALLVAVLYCSAATPWPGTWTLLPVLGTIAVIGAAAPSDGATTRILALRPIQYLGDISYSVYLWHWPIIVLTPAVVGHRLTDLEKLTVAALTLVLAALTKHQVEDRFRVQPRSTPMWRPYACAAAGIAAVVGLAGAQVLEVSAKERQARVAAEATIAGKDPCFGALALAPGSGCPNPSEGPLTPSPLAAISDRPRGWSGDCLARPPLARLTRCVHGPAQSTVDIALVGNSHAGHWLPALQELAAANNWRVTTFLAEGCPATAAEFVMRTRAASKACAAWGQRVLQATTSGKFDLVVTSELTDGRVVDSLLRPNTDPAQYRRWVDGYRAYLDSWSRSGTRVLVLRDTPLPMVNLASVPDCLSVHRANFTACAGPRELWVRPDPLADAARALAASNVTVADLTDLFCDNHTCHAVVGGAVVYFDGSHLTATFARTAAPVLGEHISASLGASNGTS